MPLELLFSGSFVVVVVVFHCIYTNNISNNTTICLLVYLGDGCSGNVNIISIWFQDREVVALLLICPGDSGKDFDFSVKAS